MSRLYGWFRLLAVCLMVALPVYGQMAVGAAEPCPAQAGEAKATSGGACCDDAGGAPAGSEPTCKSGPVCKACGFTAVTARAAAVCAPSADDACPFAIPAAPAVAPDGVWRPPAPF